MPSLRYLGPTTEDIDVMNRLRLQTEISGALTPEMVTDQVNTALVPKANTFYLGNASGQRVTPSAIAGKGDNLLHKTSNVDVPGGAASLSGGRIADSRLPHSFDRPGGRSWLKVAEFSNTNLTISSGVYSSTVEQQIGTFTVNGPAQAWFPIFSGDFSLSGGKGEVCIKQGTRYLARAISGNDGNVWWTCGIIPTANIISYTGTVTFQITRRAFFNSTNLGGGFRFTCLAIPA